MLINFNNFNTFMNIIGLMKLKQVEKQLNIGKLRIHGNVLKLKIIQLLLFIVAMQRIEKK